MIIWGIRKVFLRAKTPKSPICMECGESTLVIKVFSRHLHAFWIPILPIGKTGFAECSSCKAIFKPRKLNEQHFRAFTSLKRESSIPIWQATGFGILLLAIGLGGYQFEQDKKLEAQYIAQPAIGDIYKFKTKNGQYSTLNVIQVTKDSIFVFANTLESKKRSKIYKIEKSENYSIDTTAFAKTQIVEMYYSKVILDVTRK